MEFRPHLQSSPLAGFGFGWASAPLVPHSGLENPDRKQFVTLPSPACETAAHWTMTSKLTKEVKHVLVEQDCFLDEQLRPRRGRQLG